MAGEAGDVVHGAPWVGTCARAWAGLHPQGRGRRMDGKRPPISMIPVPDTVSIKELFMEEAR